MPGFLDTLLFLLGSSSLETKGRDTASASWFLFLDFCFTTEAKEACENKTQNQKVPGVI